MSIKVYRLLRNNKEEGPFTTEELIRKNLRPYDLIWIDGSSAAWRYPGEIPQFKQLVPLPEAENTQQVATPKPRQVAQAAINVNNNLPPAAKEKPRYKVSAAWSRVQTTTAVAAADDQTEKQKKGTIKKNMVTARFNAISSKSLSWEEAWLDWEKEKEAPDDIPPVIQPAITKHKKTPVSPNEKTEPVLQTKFAQPLDVLEDKYIDTILQQRQKSRRSFAIGKTGNILLPMLALIIIFSIAYWLLHDTNMAALPASAQNKANAVAANATQAGIAVIKDDNTTTASLQKPVTSITASNALTERAKERKKIYIPTASKADNNPVQAKQAATPAVNNLIEKPETVSATPAANTTPVEDNTTTAAAAKLLVSSKKLIANYVSLPSQIEMKNGIANIKIENVSDVDLDLVVVDVQYFTASDNFKKGETFYLHHLKAGKNVTIKTPKDAASAYATSKISLISSDAKQLYVVGDN